MKDPWRPRIAVSIGDPNGIGPEVAMKALALAGDEVEAVLVGDPGVLEHHAAGLGVEVPWPIQQPSGLPPCSPAFGDITAPAGEHAMRAVEHAVELCLSGVCDAMVTAPISKEAISLGGYTDPGHTEFIARLCATSDPLMVMVAGGLRVGLVSAHVPLRQVASAVTRPAIAKRLACLAASLKSDFGIEEPRIAVLGLNPHAGDGGVLGTEEIDVIRPAMEDVRPILTSGPFPADGFFAERRDREFDAVLAMYHDQGLVPFKTIAFDSGVNFTAGLPIIRTSPDHGTAFDIAGKGVARPDSMLNAIRVAVTVARARRQPQSTA